MPTIRAKLTLTPQEFAEVLRDYAMRQGYMPENIEFIIGEGADGLAAELLVRPLTDGEREALDMPTERSLEDRFEALLARMTALLDERRAHVSESVKAPARSQHDQPKPAPRAKVDLSPTQRGGEVHINVEDIVAGSVPQDLSVNVVEDVPASIYGDRGDAVDALLASRADLEAAVYRAEVATDSETIQRKIALKTDPRVIKAAEAELPDAYDHIPEDEFVEI